jgi:hypothetical protein
MFEKTNILRQDTEEKNEASSDELFSPDGAGERSATVLAEQDRRRTWRLQELKIP